MQFQFHDLPNSSDADEPERQEPLGPHPDYQDVLDLACAYSFPCSDPIAVQACCAGIAKRAAAADDAQPLPPRE